jgi:glucose-6-phosphate 1-dehydrogenase
MLAMDPPAGQETEVVRDEKARIFRAMRPLDPASTVRGQYRGYRDEEGVARDSAVETFAAVRVEIDSWRWAGVPFLIRAGKRLPVTLTEVLVTLRRPPQAVLGLQSPPGGNYVRFRLGPDVVIAIGARAKQPGEALRGESIELCVQEQESDGLEPYERLLGEAMRGDPTLFSREDSVELAWRVVAPVLSQATPLRVYEPGSWGPGEAESLAPGGWYRPEPRC